MATSSADSRLLSIENPKGVLPDSTRLLGRLLTQTLDFFAGRPMLAFLLPGILQVALALAFVRPFGFPDPLVGDEFSYLLGADTFASGRLANPTHPMWKHFEAAFVLQRPTYVSMYHPAQALFMAAGQRLFGHPWYGVVLSTALLCMFSGWMLQAWMPRRWAVLGSLLTVQMVFMGLWWDQTGYWTNSYWGGAVAALAGAFVLGALGRFRHRLNPWVSALFALGIVILSVSRPFEGVLLMLAVTAVLISYFLQKRFSSAQWIRNFILPATLVLIIGGACYSYYCYRTTGKPTRLPYQEVLRQYMTRRMFFWEKHNTVTYNNPEIEKFYKNLMRPGRTLKFRVTNTFGRLSKFYFGPLIGLALLALPFVFRDRRFRPILLAAAVVFVGVWIVEWIHIHYIAPIALAFIAISVQCLRHIATLNWRHIPIGKALVLLLVVAHVTSNSVTAAQGWTARRVGWHVQRTRIQEQLQSSGGKHLVIVRFDPTNTRPDEWTYNRADIDRSQVVWARELNENDDLIKYFSDRKIWLLEADELPMPLVPYPSARTKW